MKEVLQAASQLKQGKNNLISKFTNYVGVNTKASEQLTSYVDYLENYGFCFVANVFGSEVFDRNLFYKLSVGDHFN